MCKRSNVLSRPVLMLRGLDGYFDRLALRRPANSAVFKLRRELGRSPLSVVIARGPHLFPFRTEQLSPSAPMVLGPRGPGRVGRRRSSEPVPFAGRALLCSGSFVGPGHSPDRARQRDRVALHRGLRGPQAPRSALRRHLRAQRRGGRQRPREGPSRRPRLGSRRCSSRLRARRWATPARAGSRAASRSCWWTTGPGVTEDRAHLVAVDGDERVRVVLARHEGGHWSAQVVG